MHSVYSYIYINIYIIHRLENANRTSSRITSFHLNNIKWTLLNVEVFLKPNTRVKAEKFRLSNVQGIYSKVWTYPRFTGLFLAVGLLLHVLLLQIPDPVKSNLAYRSFKWAPILSKFLRGILLRSTVINVTFISA